MYNQVGAVLVSIVAQVQVRHRRYPCRSFERPHCRMPLLTHSEAHLADAAFQAPLIKTVDGLLVNVFVGIKVLLPSILDICAHIFVSLHINISVLLVGVVGLLGGLINTVLGLVGGLVGGIL